MKVEENVLAKFLVALILWKLNIVAIFKTNSKLKCLSACQKMYLKILLGATFAVKSLKNARRMVPKSLTLTTLRIGLWAPSRAGVT